VNLEGDFEQECRAAVNECRSFGYHPTAWVAMMNEFGAAEAARRLVISGDIQSGFQRLVQEGRIDLTLEFAVLHPKWDSLFRRDIREAAWWRLSQPLQHRN